MAAEAGQRPTARRARFDVEELEKREVPAVIFNEGFEGAFPGGNWSTNASQGRNWKGVSDKAHSGSWSGFGSYSSQNSGSRTYANNMNTYMERTVNLLGYTAPVLSFYDWLNTESGYDFLRVKINGTQLWRDSGNKQNWNYQGLSLSNYAGQSNVTIRVGPAVPSRRSLRSDTHNR